MLSKVLFLKVKLPFFQENYFEIEVKKAKIIRLEVAQVDTYGSKFVSIDLSKESFIVTIP